MSKTINKLLAEIFDIYPTDKFVNKFVNNNEVDIDQILNDSLLHLNIVYCDIWYFIYKTYPTKKDFIDFIKQNNIDENIIFDKNLLDKIINSFIPLKVGLFNLINLEELLQKYTKIINNFKIHCYSSNFIIQKIKYRYNIKDNELTISSNLLVTILTIIKIYNEKDNTNVINYFKKDNINPINQSINENINYNINDNLYLNSYEKIQYIIYKDVHFIMKFIDNTVIYIDNVKNINDILYFIIDKYITTFDKHVVLFNYDNNINYDSQYMFDIIPEIYNILPCISKCHLTISNNLYPTIKSLALKRDNTIYYLRDTINKNIKDNIILQMYDKYIVNSIELLNNSFIELQKYLILDPIINNYYYNDDVDIYIKSANLSQNQINILTNKYKYVHFTDNIDNSTIIIDMNDNNINVFDYMQRGVIPIVKNNSKYIKHMVNGIVISNQNDLFEQLDTLLSNREIINVLQHGIKTFKFIISDDVQKYLWTTHIKTPCPFRSNNTRFSILLYCNFMVQYYIKHLDSIALLGKNIKKKSTTNCVVLVDNRDNILSLLSIIFTLINLNESWTCRIYTSKKGLSFYKNMFNITNNICEVIHEPILDVPKFHIDVYNKLLTNSSFWNSLSEYDKCLIIQDDGVVLRKGIEKFLLYDYVGSPWIDVPENNYIKTHCGLQGNGGLSLRNIKLMKEIVEIYQQEKNTLFFHEITNMPEDVYFSKYIKLLNSNTPTHSEASFFGSEEILNNQSLGIHKVWNYHEPKNVKQYFDLLL